MEEATESWHGLEGKDVLARFGADPNKGLSSAQAEENLKIYGPNQLKGKRKKTAIERFLEQFHQPLVYILLVAGAVTWSLDEHVDSFVIFGVVLLNAIVGYVQEARAVKAIEALAESMRTEANVWRDGALKALDSVKLVPGDIVLLRSGDKVPADMRLFAVKELRVDESALTGESVPVEKKNDVLKAETVLAERVNMVYAGTLVTYGQARGVIVATGGKTELGRISHLIDQVETLETPLTKKIARFSQAILWVIMGFAAATFALGLWRGEPIVDIFMVSVALAVAAIPEGLPAAMTIILAIGVSRLAARKAIIRRLPAVETLGSVTAICTDKTGTLTKNQMTVQKIYAGGAWADVTGAGYELEGAIKTEDGGEAAEAVKECLRAGLLCNDAQLEPEGESVKILGDPTEAALLVAAAKVGFVHEREKAAFPRLDDVPFESELQYMATLHALGDEGLIYLKGSAERVLALCANARDGKGGQAPLDVSALLQIVETMASQGLRVLALASKKAPTGKDKLGKEDLGGMTFLGFQGMIDPPRPEAIEAIAACHRAGVAVKMITGDHAGTAVAIARSLNLIGAEETRPLSELAYTGAELEKIPDSELPEKARDCSVFARVTPEQKLRLVTSLQSLGEVCAMTGDGVNDAPALKQANIGVAMGIAGTEAAKEASDMVLLDDNFATIRAAVEEGRGIFDNLVKFIAWTLPTNLGEGFMIMIAFAMGGTLPILPVQILWVNMSTAVCLGLMLAFESKEDGIMNRPPRDPQIPILSPFVVQRILMVGFLLLVSSFGLFEWEMADGEDLDKARTVALNALVIGELAYLFNTRSFLKSPFAIGFFSNMWVIWGALGMILLQLGITYLPFMNVWFGTAPIGWTEWGRIAGASLILFAIVEAEKKLRIRFGG